MGGSVRAPNRNSDLCHTFGEDPTHPNSGWLESAFHHQQGRARELVQLPIGSCALPCLGGQFKNECVSKWVKPKIAALFKVSLENPPKGVKKGNPFFSPSKPFFPTLPCFFNPSSFLFNPPPVFLNPPPFFFNPPPFLSDPPPLPFNPPFLFCQPCGRSLRQLH